MNWLIVLKLLQMLRYRLQIKTFHGRYQKVSQSTISQIQQLHQLPLKQIQIALVNCGLKNTDQNCILRLLVTNHLLKN
jgi:hypothetical protein